LNRYSDGDGDQGFGDRREIGTRFGHLASA